MGVPVPHPLCLRFASERPRSADALLSLFPPARLPERGPAQGLR